MTTHQTGKVHVWWQKFFPKTFLRKRVWLKFIASSKSVKTHILEVILTAWDRSVSLNWWLLSLNNVFEEKTTYDQIHRNHVTCRKTNNNCYSIPFFFLSPCATAFTLQHIAGILQQLRKASTESTSRLWPWCARRRQPLSTSCCAQRILRKQQRTAPGRNGTTTFYCVFCADRKSVV